MCIHILLCLISFISPHQYKAKGHVCRVAYDECDFPEYCNGSSASCQDDFFIQNGFTCGFHGICLNGKCLSEEIQCADTFGEGIYYSLMSHICIFLETEKIC